MNYINVLIIVFVLFIGYTFFLNKRKTEVKEINKQYSLVDDLSYSNQKTIDSGFVKPKQKLHKLFKNVSKKLLEKSIIGFLLALNQSLYVPKFRFSPKKNPVTKLRYNKSVKKKKFKVITTKHKYNCR